MQWAQIFAGLVILVAVAKFGYDNFLSSVLTERDRKNGLEGAELFDAAQRRMKIANTLTFLSTTVLSAAIVYLGAGSEGITSADLEKIQQRIEALEGN